MSPRKPRSRPLRRPVEVKRERRIIAIFTEGEGSEPDYIIGLAKEHVDSNTVKVVVSDKHGVPRTLVDLAKQCKKDDEIDDVWCVFDVECPTPHPYLHEACQTARAAQVEVAVSNPCFEYWLALHFDNHTKPETSADMESLSRKFDGRPKKRIDFHRHYASNVDEACERARRQEQRHLSAGTRFPQNNPSTSVYRLVEFMKGLRPPRELDVMSRHVGRVVAMKLSEG